MNPATRRVLALALVGAVAAASEGTAQTETETETPRAADVGVTGRLGISRDSDLITSTTAGLAADLALSSGVRLGLELKRLSLSSDWTSVAAHHAGLFGSLRRRALRMEVTAGVVALPAAPRDAGGSDRILPELRFRTRTGLPSGFSLDLRGSHVPVSASPELLHTGVVLSELRGTVDLPLVGPFLGRILTRAGRIEAPEDTNARVGVGGGAVARIGATSEVGAYYHRTGYRSATSAPYFAPEAIDAVELAAYSEYYGAWPLTLALEAGVGLDRLTPWNAAPAAWKPAARLWSLASWELESGSEIRVELEAYDTRASGALVSGGSGWRSGSVSTSFRVRTR